ncbi:MAG TPA: hypothetical protein VMB52_07135 [Verrucomicrobiae bacterium]|nr:hypothetical protein [Verrucomicrobiae bacterium]
MRTLLTKRLKIYLLSVALLCAFTAWVSLPSAVHADPTGAVCTALGSGGAHPCSGTPTNGVNLDSVINAVVTILSTIAGVIAVIMIIIAGFLFMTANGDSGKITTARHSVMYALVGVIVVAFAQVFVHFVLGRIL